MLYGFPVDLSQVHFNMIINVIKFIFFVSSDLNLSASPCLARAHLMDQSRASGLHSSDLRHRCSLIKNSANRTSAGFSNADSVASREGNEGWGASMESWFLQASIGVPYASIGGVV